MISKPMAVVQDGRSGRLDAAGLLCPIAEVDDGRAVTRRPPVRKTGELKDCTIYEESLEVCMQLQRRGFMRKMLFCTSNTDDSCALGVSPSCRRRARVRGGRAEVYDGASVSHELL